MLSHNPLLDVRPHGRNQDKPVRYCIASCINIWDEERAASSLVGSGPPGQGTDKHYMSIHNKIILLYATIWFNYTYIHNKIILLHATIWFKYMFIHNRT